MMDTTNIVKIIEVKGHEAANKLLDRNWLLLTTYVRVDGGPQRLGCVHYSLGLPGLEHWTQPNKYDEDLALIVGAVVDSNRN